MHGGWWWRFWRQAPTVLALAQPASAWCVNVMDVARPTTWHHVQFDAGLPLLGIAAAVGAPGRFFP